MVGTLQGKSKACLRKKSQCHSSKKQQNEQQIDLFADGFKDGQMSLMDTSTRPAPSANGRKSTAGRARDVCGRAASKNIHAKHYQHHHRSKVQQSKQAHPHALPLKKYLYRRQARRVCARPKTTDPTGSSKSIRGVCG